MRILLDTCVWGGARQTLEEAGHDVIWTGDWNEDPGDDAILAYAYREDRVLVTLDKDFGELAVVFGRPHAGIIRLVNLSARRQGPFCARVLASHRGVLVVGAIVTVSPRRIRVRLADDGENRQ